jgi:chemotaxis protein MotB
MAKHKKAGGGGGGGGGGHDGGGSMRWLLTYADMITLLMAFFIMMYSMSVLNLAKFNQVAFSIRSGFGGVLKGGKHLLPHQPGKAISALPQLQDVKPMRDAEQQLVQMTISKKLQNELEVSYQPRGLVVSIAVDGLLFKAGSSVLETNARPIMAQIAHALAVMPNDIMVEGHTCTMPIATATYPSNWELSTARASSVVRFLIGRGIAPSRLIAVGYADTRPRVANDTEAHRVKNRRVDIVLLYHAEKGASKEPGEQQLEQKNQPEQRVRPSLTKVFESDASSSEGEE